MPWRRELRVPSQAAATRRTIVSVGWDLAAPTTAKPKHGQPDMEADHQGLLVVQSSRRRERKIGLLATRIRLVTLEPHAHDGAEQMHVVSSTHGSGVTFALAAH